MLYRKMWEQCKDPIVRHAKRQKSYAPQAWKWGRSADELECVPLISWVWVMLLRDQPWLQTPEDMQKYFFAQIDGRVKNLTRPRADKHGLGLKMDWLPTGVRDDDADVTDPMANIPGSEDTERRLRINDFLRHLMRMRPDLLRVCELSIEQQKKRESPETENKNELPAIENEITEIAKKMNLTDQQVYGLRSELRKCLEHYGEEAASAILRRRPTDITNTKNLLPPDSILRSPEILSGCEPCVTLERPDLLPLVAWLKAGVTRIDKLSKNLQISKDKIFRLLVELEEHIKKCRQDAEPCQEIPKS